MNSKTMHTISFFLLLMGSLMLLFNLLTVASPENLTLFNVYCAMTIVFIQRAVKPRPSGRGYKAHLNWNFCLFVCAVIDWNL